jgi:hypothetical protein
LAPTPSPTWPRTTAARKLFIDSSLKLAADHGFVGIDLDWEDPGTTAAIDKGQGLDPARQPQVRRPHLHQGAGGARQAKLLHAPHRVPHRHQRQGAGRGHRLLALHRGVGQPVDRALGLLIIHSLFIS